MLDVRPPPASPRPGLVMVGLLLAIVGLLLVVAHRLGLAEVEVGPLGSSAERVVAEASNPEPSTRANDLAGQGPELGGPVDVAPLVGAGDRPAPKVREPPLDALWPTRRSRQLYDKPGEAAGAFTADYLGFTSSIVDRYLPFDDDVGVVPVRATSDGPVTSVLVHRLAVDGSWWVLAASSDAVTVDGPAAGISIDDPIHVFGTAQTVVGVVRFELRLVGRDEPVLVREFQTGGGDETQWFEGLFGWSSALGGRGVALLSIPDPAGGGTLAATVVPVDVAPSNSDG